MTFLSLNSWSLHRNLGPLRITKWDEVQQNHTMEIVSQPELTTLLELPAILAQKGFKALEVCHFHFPETSDDYLGQLKDAFHKANIRFYTLLIDYGDISNDSDQRRDKDIAWIKQWIDIASKVGAERVRIIAGDAEPQNKEALERSAQALRQLCDYALARKVRVVTENFRALSFTADNCLSLLEMCGEKLGLTSDFGNFTGANKYTELAKTIPFSESIHAKAEVDASGALDIAEFTRCMDIVKQTAYKGPITLVYDGPNDMWEGIEQIQQATVPYLK